MARRIFAVTILSIVSGITACGTSMPIDAVLQENDPDGIYLSIIGSEGSMLQLAASTPKQFAEAWYCDGAGECDSASGTSLIRSSESPSRIFYQFPTSLDAAQGITLTIVTGNPDDASSTVKTRVVRIGRKPTGQGSGGNNQGSGQNQQYQQLYDWQKEIALVSIPAVNRACDLKRFQRFYCDVMRHTRSPYLNSGDPSTDVHETQHFMLHEHAKSGQKFIYWQDGKGGYFPEPKTLTRDIVSKILFKNGMYYKTYIASRPNQVLGENIVDEWRAYLTEEIYGIEVGNSRGMGAGGIEFLYYNAAMLHALSEKEPSYLTNKQGIAVFAMLAEIAHEWSISKGVNRNFFDSHANQRAKNILALMRTDGDHAPMRETLKKIYGQTWTQRVLGF